MPRTATPRRPPAPPRRSSRATFSDELRDAIDRSGLTPYAIGRESGVDPGILSRFLSGRRGVTSETIDRLAATLGLHLTAPTRARGRSRRPAGPEVGPAADGDTRPAEASGNAAPIEPSVGLDEEFGQD